MYFLAQFQKIDPNDPKEGLYSRAVSNNNRLKRANLNKNIGTKVGGIFTGAIEDLAGIYSRDKFYKNGLGLNFKDRVLRNGNDFLKTNTGKVGLGSSLIGLGVGSEKLLNSKKQ